MLGWLVNERAIEPHIPVFDKSARVDATFSREAFDIRRLVELGLTVRTRARPEREDQQGREDRKQRARELASNAIDKVTDPSASPDD